MLEAMSRGMLAAAWSWLATACCLLLLSLTTCLAEVAPAFHLLDPGDHAEQLFGDGDWAESNVPYFECSDQDVTTAYFFRWHSYKQHIKHHPDTVGYVVTEFLPDVEWAGPYNTISCAAGHHIYEGRWLRDPAVIDNYTSWWTGGGADTALRYSFWLVDATWARYCATGDAAQALQLLPQLAAYVEAVHRLHWVEAPGCYFQGDNSDGSEVSISGDGCRPTINSIMFGELQALAELYSLAGQPRAAQAARSRAAVLQARTLQLLWNRDLQFLSVLALDAPPWAPVDWCGGSQPVYPGGTVAPVRELLGLAAPYYFSLVPQHAAGAGDPADVARFHRMWDQVLDPDGFAGAWGLRTAERRHPLYNYSCQHECNWNAPSWPFETSRLLTGLGVLLNDYPAGASVMNASVHWQLLQQYARIHTRSVPTFPEDERGQPAAADPWIGEDIHPDDGHWIARDKLHRWERNSTNMNRGYKYNHSSFNDLVITGLVGLRPRPDGLLVVNPLVTAQALSYFALDNLRYHGHDLAIFWDADGLKYGHGAGLHLWVDGVEVAHSSGLQRLVAFLPASAVQA